MTETSYRNSWIFEIPAEQVLHAARDKRTHHNIRLSYWEEEVEKAEEELRSKGVEFRETANVNNSYSTQQGVQVVIDPQRQRYLSDCQAKVQHHQYKVHEYETYVSALESYLANNSGRLLQMTVDDMQFFGM